MGQGGAKFLHAAGLPAKRAQPVAGLDAQGCRIGPDGQGMRAAGQGLHPGQQVTAIQDQVAAIHLLGWGWLVQQQQDRGGRSSP